MTAVFPPVGPTPLERHLEKLRQVGAMSVPMLTPCNCIGRQNGQPACPCEMRFVTVENGRYVRRIDLGPAP